MRLFATSLLALSLAACSPANNETAAADSTTNAADVTAAGVSANQMAALPPANVEPTPSPSATPSLEPLNPPAPGEPGGLPDDRTPVSEAPFTPDSPQGAANVVQTYYALIEAGKYAQAWKLWDNGGDASGMSAQAFAASFDKYSEVHANVGAPGEIEAGAGQRYVTVPVQVYGRLKATGKPFNMLGPVTLHRTGDIDGATAEQKSWRIQSIGVKPRP